MMLAGYCRLHTMLQVLVIDWLKASWPCDTIEEQRRLTCQVRFQKVRTYTTQCIAIRSYQVFWTLNACMLIKPTFENCNFSPSGPSEGDGMSHQPWVHCFTVPLVAKVMIDGKDIGFFFQI